MEVSDNYNETAVITGSINRLIIEDAKQNVGHKNNFWC
jgi:hypothetical protein